MRTLTDQDVYRYFLGDVVIGDMYNSPIPGRKDDTPSFAVYEKNGELRWVDHGLANQYGNKVENLVQYLRGLPLTSAGYYAAKKLIETEVKIGMMGSLPTQLRSRPKYDRPPYITSGPLRDYEKAYWDRFDLSEEYLTYEGVNALHSMGWNENGEPQIISTPDDPVFIYWWGTNPASYKIYRPLVKNKRDKFRQYNVDGVIEGWTQMKTEFENGGVFDILFILSSSKDRFVVKSAFGNSCSGINPRGEKDRMDIVVKAAELRSMAKRVVCLYDADDPGYEASKTLAELTGFEYFDTRGKLHGWKDFADMKDKTKGNLPYDTIKETILSLTNV